MSKVFETKNIQNSNKICSVFSRICAFVDVSNQPSKRSWIPENNESQEDHTSTQPESHLNEDNDEENNVDEDNEIQNIGENQEQSGNTKGNTTETETTSNNQQMYNFKDITMEVIQQMKEDIVKVKNLLIPEIFPGS